MEILIILVLILLNGIFAMSEIAVVSSRKARLEAAAKRGDQRAKAALHLANNPGKFLSTVQIGITVIGIVTGIYSGAEITDDFEAFLNRFELLRPYSEEVAITAVVVVLTYFSLVLGELVPKRLGLARPEGIAKIIARPMNVLSIITAPFIWLLTLATDFFIKIFNIKKTKDSQGTEEEIKAILREGREAGSIE